MEGSTTVGRARGLADVVAVRTRLSRVDGRAGELILAGHHVEELALGHGFETVCHLLWHGSLPDGAALSTLRADLVRRRVVVHERIAAEGPADLDDPMDHLRAILSRVQSTGDLLDDAATLVAAVPVANAWWWARRNGRTPPTPAGGLSTAAYTLHAVTGGPPSEAAERAMDRYLVTVADHGMNASTFTARVIASTRSDMVSAVAGAVGALKGPLHGGAPGPVLEMLDAIGVPERAEAWLTREMEAGRRIMGMGHRVYRVRDPRAAIFERAVSELSAEGGETPRLALAHAVEAAATALLAARHPGRDLRANVEFYTAVLLEALGLPRALFSATFAVGRVAGWTAHVMEQRAEDTLIRPRAEYVGAVPA
jgi:citrate synthase